MYMNMNINNYVILEQSIRNCDNVTLFTSR